MSGDRDARRLQRDTHWMSRALALAEQARGQTSPNPMVGAVIVRESGDEDLVLGEGFHRRAGLPHAEIEALAAAREAGHDVAGATMYVTLEPCCHTGRTGPCTKAVIAAGIARVVVAQVDPNPLVAGAGLAELEAAGLEVVRDVLREPAEALNASFRKWIATRRPLVTLKLASSLDGRIAARPDERTAVTGTAAQARVMALRAAQDLVLVGANTARTDDPQLTVRTPDGEAVVPGPERRLPLRGVVDTRLTLPDLTLTTAPGTVVVTAAPGDHPRALELTARGLTLVHVPATKDGRVDLAAALAQLGVLAPRPITAVLVEGGGTLAASLLEADLVDRLVWHLAPKLFGAGGVPSVGPLAAPLSRLALRSVERLGDDLELTFTRQEPA